MTQVSPQGGGREPNKPTPEDVKQDLGWFLIAVTRKREVVILDHSEGWKEFDIEHWWADTFTADEPGHLDPGAYVWSGFEVGSWEEGDLISLSGGTFTAWNTRTPASTSEALPNDVRALVIAARQFWDDNHGDTAECRELDKALEAFSSRVPYGNEVQSTPSTPEASEQVEALRGEVERIVVAVKNSADRWFEFRDQGGVALGAESYDAGDCDNIGRAILGVWSHVATLSHAEEGGK